MSGIVRMPKPLGMDGFGVDTRGVVTAAPSALNAYYAALSGSTNFHLPFGFARLE